MHSFSHAHCLAAGRGRRSCLALYGSASGSGLRSPYASSPTHQAVSCSTLLYLWTGSSSPVASHPAFRRRSFLRLRTASVLSDGDFHPTVGAHSQAHVGTRSRAIRRCASDANVQSSASDGSCAPARPARVWRRRRHADTPTRLSPSLRPCRLVRSRSIGNQVSSWFPGRIGYDRRR